MNSHRVVRCTYCPGEDGKLGFKRLIADGEILMLLGDEVLQSLGTESDPFFGLPHVDIMKVVNALAMHELDGGSISEGPGDNPGEVAFEIVLHGRRRRIPTGDKQPTTENDLSS